MHSNGPSEMTVTIDICYHKTSDIVKVNIAIANSFNTSHQNTTWQDFGIVYQFEYEGPYNLLLTFKYNVETVAVLYINCLHKAVCAVVGVVTSLNVV